MKALFPTLILLCITFTGVAQTQTSYAAWQHPIIKQIQAKAANLLVYSDTNTFVNIAAVDTKSKLIYWITAIGYVNDVAKLSDFTYNRIITKKETPFEYYYRLTKDAIQLYDAAIFKYRFPKLKLYDKDVPDYDEVVTEMMGILEFTKAKTPLEKLAALYKERQRNIDKLVFSNIAHPNKVKQDTTYVYHLSNITRGKVTVTERTDSTGFADFYSKDDKSPIYKATLDIAKAKIYFYHQNQSIFDSLTIKRKKIETLFTESTDIFTLYQNYSLWKLTAIDSIAKLVDNYKAKKYTSLKERKNTEAILTSFGGSSTEATAKIRAAHKVILSKLDILLATDLHFLEQELNDEISKQNPHLRLGEYINNQLVIYPPAPNDIANCGIHTITRGNMHYQLTDHRSNVMVVVNDKKIGHDDNHDGIIDYYTSEVVKATDYSSFGAPLPGRTFEIAAYKYGYNGKEEDKETGYTDYGSRMYDPNIGRFLSIDPLLKQFPYYTPYQFAGNMPIANVDLDGKEPKSVINELGQLTIPVIGFLSTALSIEESVLENTTWFIGNGNLHFEIAGKPNAITIGNKVYYSQEKADQNQDSDVPGWVELVGHEESHRQDYEEQGFYGFVKKYSSDYDANIKAGQSKYSAYSNIETEKKAFGNEATLGSFFKDANNTKAFNSILNSTKYGQLEKSDRLKLLGLQKIAIPQIENKIKQLNNTLNSIDPKKDFLGTEKRLTTIAIDSYKTQLINKQNEATNLNTKIQNGNYQSLPGDN